MITKQQHTLVEVLGWYGVGAILSAYALLSFHILSADTTAYQILNITGAIGIILDAWVDRNYQPVVLNVLWLLIATIALIRIFL